MRGRGRGGGKRCTRERVRFIFIIDISDEHSPIGMSAQLHDEGKAGHLLGHDTTSDRSYGDIHTLWWGKWVTLRVRSGVSERKDYTGSPFVVRSIKCLSCSTALTQQEMSIPARYLSDRYQQSVRLSLVHTNLGIRRKAHQRIRLTLLCLKSDLLFHTRGVR